MHRYTLLALLPVVLGCANPESNECASYMTNNVAIASAFCATFTQGTVTATADLPTWASACSYKPKHISKECSCHFTAGGDGAEATPEPVETAEPIETDAATSANSTPAPIKTETPAETQAPVQTQDPTTLNTVVATSAKVSSVANTPASTAAETPASTQTGSAGGTDGSSCGSAAEDELVGYGVGSTGGGSGSGTTVTSCSELSSAVAAGGVITISGLLADCDIIELVSDTTIIGSGAESGTFLLFQYYVGYIADKLQASLVVASASRQLRTS